MDYTVTITPNKINKWPMHSHKYWGIMYCIKGSGTLITENGKIPFKENTVIVIPPNTVHGISSKEYFTNISIGGNFGKFLSVEKVVTFNSSTNSDGLALCQMLLSNSKTPQKYIYHILIAFLEYVAQNLEPEESITTASLKKISDDILHNYFDCEYNVTEVLKASGYSEDYIRNKFKQQYKCSPITFLQNVRIENAVHLMEMYGEKLSISQYAEMCGFKDYVYFSKIFKKTIGLSPINFMKINK